MQANITDKTRYVQRIVTLTRIGAMVSVLASSVVDRVFNPQLYETKECNIGICCFSAKHTTLRRKIKDWLACNQDNVSEWGVMSILKAVVSMS
jgi:hypothetical protein